jgi:hypothetical protein
VTVRHDGVVGTSPDGLDQVASMLAQWALGYMGSADDMAIRVEDEVQRAPKGLRRLVWLKASVQGAMKMGGVGRDTGAVRLEARQIYEEVTGLGNEQVRADMRLLGDRLFQLASVTEVDAELVHRVSHRLVHWTASGRPDDPGIAETEAHFERSMKFQEGGARAWKSPRCAVLKDAYEQAWRDALGGQGSD